MLSLFPNLFAFPLLAFFILRITLAYNLALITKARFKKAYSFIGVFELTATILLAIGLYTQGALLATMTLLILESFIDHKLGVSERKEGQIRLILGMIACALMFLGAGAFALDLPL